MPNKIEYEDEINHNKQYKLSSIIINITNALIFGIGLTLFIIGILYLTIYRYNYSFTVFSIDLLAGIFVAVGVIMCLLGIGGVFLIKPLGRPIYSILFSVLIFIFFLLIFILGVIGLSMNNNGEFLNQNRINMQSTARRYDESNPNFHMTKKINWLHKKFTCCGIDSYNDWKSILTFRGNNGPVKYYGQYNYDNKYPYIDDVPDSCCVSPSYNCGKNINVFGRERSQIINTKGCLEVYNKYFQKDIEFLCALSICLSVICLGLSIGLMYIFTLIKNNTDFLVQTYDRNERRLFLN